MPCEGSLMLLCFSTFRRQLGGKRSQSFTPSTPLINAVSTMPGAVQQHSCDTFSDLAPRHT